MSLETTCPVIFSLEGADVSDNERALFKDANPLGFILFARNIETPNQLSALTDDLRFISGRDCPILIDQEGGRVQRMKPPHWRTHSPMQNYGDQALQNLDLALESLRFDTLRLAEELITAGVNVNCAPVLDVLCPETHDIIGDRAFSDKADIVGRLGLSVCRTFLSVGITPIIKHIPGHGRATSDSHLDLPHVKTPKETLEIIDFDPFRFVSKSDVGAAVWAMTAHIVYEDLDAELPATLSEKIINETIRGDIGFEGLLVSDDTDMKALDAFGHNGQKAEKILKAGCDLVLYCSGKLAEMEKIANSVPKTPEKTLKRLQKAAQFTKLAA